MRPPPLGVGSGRLVRLVRVCPEKKPEGREGERTRPRARSQVTDTRRSPAAQIRSALAPLDACWCTIGSIMESIEQWRAAPLALVNAKEAAGEAGARLRDLVEAGKGLEQAGDERAAARRAANAVAAHTKAFLREQVPLMELLCSPGLRARHWRDMERRTGVAIDFRDDSNMAQMLELGLQHSQEARRRNQGDLRAGVHAGRHPARRRRRPGGRAPRGEGGAGQILRRRIQLTCFESVTARLLAAAGRRLAPFPRRASGRARRRAGPGGRAA